MDFDRNAPVFVQIKERIRRDILVGVYPPDCQLPPVRQLAVDMSVNPNTVQKALSLLEESGLVITKGTLGRFVTDNTELISRAGKQAKREKLRAFFRELNALGITNDEILEFMKEELE